MHRKPFTNQSVHKGFPTLFLNIIKTLFIYYRAGHTFLTFVIPAPKFLAYLQERFERANGRLVRAKITSLQDPILEPYDVVVNCTGLGARWLVPDDTVVPVRGQITKVRYIC